MGRGLLTRIVFLQQASTHLGSVKEFDKVLFVVSLLHVDFLAVFIDLKRGIALDFSGLGAPFIGVSIQLLEDELGVVGDVTRKNGSDILAGWAPSSSEVDNQRFSAVGSGCNSCQVVSFGCQHHVSVIVGRLNTFALDLFVITIHSNLTNFSNKYTI